MKKLLFFYCVFFASVANAQEWIEVDDASRLLWQMTANGIVYFRNISEFNSAHDGCCYSYKLDVTTPGGKALWTTILAKMASHRRITLGFPSIGSSGNVQTLNFIGRHAHSTNE